MSETAASSRESTIFALAVGVVGFQIADDSFLQPQPGTSADNHLVSGLVPLTLLALRSRSCSAARAGDRCGSDPLLARRRDVR